MDVHSQPAEPSRLSDDDDGHAAAPPTESLRDAGRHLAELKAYFQHYLDAKVDSAKLSFKKFVVVMVFSLVGLLIAGAILATAGALLMIGLASMIGSWFSPPKPWVGQLIVGVIVLIGAPTATWFTLRRVTGLCCLTTRARYERKHARQRVRFGRDVAQAATDTPAGGEVGNG
jgi:hypothetical protein